VRIPTENVGDPVSISADRVLKHLMGTVMVQTDEIESAMFGIATRNGIRAREHIPSSDGQITICEQHVYSMGKTEQHT